MQLHPLTEAEAKEIVTWVYPEPYSFYNVEESEEVMREFLDGTYFSLRDGEDQLMGFFCYGKNAQVPAGRTAGMYEGEDVWDIGLGMKPELTGRGFGRSFLQKGIEFAVQRYSPRQLRLSIASFNKRAIKLYENMGFREVGSFPSKEVTFRVMTKDV
ncbi:GNAT family N-acetyltransferase [Brevibacillus choshinensis]|uniref:GNAT family N-acetyltransferase n=1 Tax=Brevibacillus choshinensis TaxID=54911 RepID=A0ABX7FUB3_BRECH|nr:GNAT family N-acetyltransferase [Brevibacillus choshinensis]QRG69314.1 GNAT family N-acetyltransferase [Brevibacillus choshinensis]